MWVSSGQDAALFWRLTPREITAIMAGAAEKARHEHNRGAWMAWHTAALVRAKKMPELDRMLMRPARKPETSNAKDEAIVRGYFMALAMRSRSRRASRPETNGPETQPKRPEARE